MFPETRELLRYCINDPEGFIGNSQSFVREFYCVDDKRIILTIDYQGGYEVRFCMKKHERVMDSHTGLLSHQNGLKGHQERQDRELVIKVVNLVAPSAMAKYQECIRYAIR